jgi:myo-inositol-1(or 4)-monophosphatase
MHPLLNIADRAARSAGKVIIQALSHLERIEKIEKQPNDFVTEVDQQAEKIIIDTIRKVYPNHGILGEESGNLPGNEEDYVWIIDPLDGTTNFIHGLLHFCVSIGIQYKGRVEHGLIYDPISQETFRASRGEGARLNNHQRLRVSSQTTIKRALLATGFPTGNSSKKEFYLKLLDAFSGQAAGLRRSGSAALDLAYVAAGRLDGCVDLGLYPWDIAAGALIVKESGGMVCDTQGGDNYLKTGNVVASNPKLCKVLLQAMHAAPE